MMKLCGHKNIFLGWLFIGFMLILMSGCGLVRKSSEDVLTVGLIQHGPPYTFGVSDMYSGFDFELANFISRKLNKRLKIKRLSFVDLEAALKNDSVDLACASMIITEERLKKMAMIHVYGKPYPYMSFVFWEAGYKDLVKDVTHIKDLFEFFEKRFVGVVKGAVWEKQLRKYNIVRIKTYACEHDAVTALKQGDIAAVVLGMLGAEFLEKQNSNVWTMQVVLDAPYGYGVGVSINKDRKDMVRQIADVIQELKDEGTIALLQLRWFGKTF